MHLLREVHIALRTPLKGKETEALRTVGQVSSDYCLKETPASGPLYFFISLIHLDYRQKQMVKVNFRFTSACSLRFFIPSCDFIFDRF
jgi:hypothetical protein